REIPSVMIIAREVATGDDTGARISVDGVARPEASAGRPIELDPGAHTFRVEKPGDEAVEQTITLYQGEHARVVRIDLRRRAPPPPPRACATGHPPLPPPPPPPPASGGSYAPAVIVGGVSIAALAASAYLGVTGRSDLANLRTSCAPTCSDDQVDPVRR